MIKYPDYNNSILNLSNSILKHYKLKHNHSSLTILDEKLEKNYKNVVVLIFDGLGCYNLKKALAEDSFLCRNINTTITSVFPPTTTAATTTIASGLAPIEHGWLGWSLHFDEVKDNVNIFINTNDENKTIAEYNVANKFIPYKSIVNRINELGVVKAYNVSEFGNYKVNSLEELICGIKDICSNNDNNYIYSYFNEPDYSMHRKGINSDEVITWVNSINNAVERLSSELKDTLLIITADHGHIDCKSEYLGYYEDLIYTLKWLPSIEARALSFFIKDGMHDKFRELFIKYFGNDFILISKEEVLKSNLFGFGNEHPKFKSFIGDYLAIAKNEKTLFYTIYEYNNFKGAHAGLTEEEMMVPLIILECKK